MENEEVIENQEIDYKVLYEQTKSEAEEKANKVVELEWLIQKHKNKPKAETWSLDVDTLLEQKLAERDFYNANPWLVEHKDKIRELTSKGISLKVAREQVIEDNPDIVARNIAQQSNFTAWTPDYNKSTYSYEDLWKLNQVEYNKVMELNKQGKVTFKK